MIRADQVTDASNTADHWAAWRYGSLAKTANRPIVSIHPRHKYAAVWCDMVYAPCRLDATAWNAIHALSTTDRRTWPNGQECRSSFTALSGVPLADTDRVAAEVFRIAMDCISRQTS